MASMRQTPSLLALLTISATLGFASQARGESLLVSTQETDAHPVGVAELIATEDEPAHSETVTAIPTRSSVAALNTANLALTEASLQGANGVAASNTLPMASGTVPEVFVSVDQLNQLAETAEALSVNQLSQQTEEGSPEDTAPDVEAPDGEIDPADPSDFDPDIELPDVEPGNLPDLEQQSPAESEIDAEDPADSEPEAPEEGEPGDDASEDDEAEDDEEDEPRGLDPDRVPQETQVLVAEVAVTDPQGNPLDPELEDTIYETIDTIPGQTTTRSQLQQDINSIFATGFFANVRAIPSDTPLGVRVTFFVEPNPVLTRVDVERDGTLPEDDEMRLSEEIDRIFSPRYGEIINLLELQDGILELNDWYQQNGYVLAQVIAAPEIQDDGIVTLQVAEGVIEAIDIQFLTEDGFTEDEEGNPIRGKTRDFIITREFNTQPGDVFQQNRIRSDLQRVFGLGIFDDVNLTLNPGRQDPRKVRVTVNVVERSTGSVAAGVGFNFTGDLFGTVSYRQDNFGGNNQKFSAETQLSTGGDILFDISFTDPWIGGDPFRTSYTVNAFARRSISLVFEGGPNEINLPTDDDDDDDDDGDRVRIQRLGGGVSFRRPLGNGWSASLGTLYQRVRTTDSDGDTAAEDAEGNQLTFSGDGTDDLWTVQFGLVRDLRNDAFRPTSGSVLRLNTEQSIPLGSGNIFFNRLRASYSYYLGFGNDEESEAEVGTEAPAFPQTLAFNIQGGTVIGDLPPYEAFALGGTNSVRGYEEGEVGAGRSFLQASIEYRFPLFSFLGGALFIDAATDLGSGDSVPGSPGPERGKPGSGFGFGAGVRVQTPLGPIRIDYGINDEGNGRLHFGIGERF